MTQTTRHFTLGRTAALAAACVLLIASAMTVYAADLGGIQRKMQLWMQGDRTDAVVTFDGAGGYTVEYTDPEGTVRHQGGGGVAFRKDGSQVPLTEEELTERLTAPDIRYEDDGTVRIYWLDQATEITDSFEDGVCYAKLEADGTTLYMTVKYQDSYASSLHKYIMPEDF